MLSQFGGGPQSKARHTRRKVVSGKLSKTSGGLTKKDLMKNKHGRLVSKKQHKQGKGNVWMIAVKQAKKELKINSKNFKDHIPKKGTKLHKRATEICEKLKAKK